jgi:two-component system, response regulator PdtaR
MGQKVLIVEDELIVAEDLKLMLEGWNYEVIGTVASGKTALRLSKQLRPDILLMDVRIEGNLNGVETTLAIRSFFGEEIPVVFLSARPSNENPIISAMGKYIYVNKPFTQQELLSAVKSFDGNN